MKKPLLFASIVVVSVLACAAHAQTAAPANGSEEPAEASSQAFGDLLEQAQAAAEKGKLEQAVSLTQEALKAKPDDRAATFQLARLTQARGLQLIQSKKTGEGYALFVIAAERMQSLKKKHQELTPAEQTFLANAMYNAACAHSLGGNAKRALSSLEDALEAGFEDFDQLTSDVDLQAVRALPEFGMLLQKQLQRPAVAAKLLNERAAHLFRQEKYSQATELLKQSLEIFRQLYPESEYPMGHRILDTSLNNLGVVLEKQRAYGEARKYFQQALEMERRLYPKEKYPQGHLHLSQSLIDLGNLLRSQGDYGEARKYLQQALEMRQRLFPNEKGHPDLADSLNFLGHLLQSQGEFDEAHSCFHQALEMRRRFYPEEKGHPDLATSLNNVGAVLQSQHKYEEADKSYRQALEMKRRLYPVEKYPQGHPGLAMSLNNLAVSLKSQGKYVEARKYYDQALEQQRQLFPKGKYPLGHPDLALSLNNLGLLLHDQGDYGEARKFFQQALEMYRRHYPIEEYPRGHIDLARCLSNLGGLCMSQGEPGEARTHLAQGLSMYQNLAAFFLATASEAESLNFLAQLPTTQNSLVTVWWDLDEPVDELYASMWRGRRAIQRMVSGRQQALGAMDDPRIQTRYRELLDARRALARVTLAPAEADPSLALARRERLRELATLKERLERELADSIPAFQHQLAMRQSEHTQLVQHLPPGTVFVDMFSYVRGNQDASRAGKQGERNSRCYIAFLLRRDEPVVRVDLRSASHIDAAVSAWRQDIIAGKTSPAAKTLRRLVWEPIAKELPEEFDQVFLCPDGRLTAIPWAALPGKEPGTVLLEEHALALVPHGQFLLSSLTDQPASDPQQGRVLMVGNVNYDSQPMPPPPESSQLATRSAVQGDNQLVWQALPGTKDELEALERLAGRRSVVQLTGSQANTHRLLAELPQARWAHLATHGFFADAKFRSALQLDQTAFEQPQFSRTGERTAVAARNPLVLSGLVLAGANLPRPTDGFGIPHGDGGILTAEAIAGLPLQNPEMVVLSACETGLGQVAGGEGVFGLQRAFHIAGARNVVASLWKVDDQATAALMRLFYYKLWQENKPPLQSLREAQLALYRHPAKIKELSTSRGPDFGQVVKLMDKKSTRLVPTTTPTKLWAAFVLSGTGR